MTELLDDGTTWSELLQAARESVAANPSGRVMIGICPRCSMLAICTDPAKEVLPCGNCHTMVEMFNFDGWLRRWWERGKYIRGLAFGR